MAYNSLHIILLTKDNYLIIFTYLLFSFKDCAVREQSAVRGIDYCVGGESKGNVVCLLMTFKGGG